MSSPRIYFVYGTLRPGSRYWSNVAAMIADYAPAFVDGFELYDIPGEGYPAILPGHGRVFGDLLFVRHGYEAKVVEIVDEIEEYDPSDPGSLFLRRPVEAVRMREPDEGAVPAETYVFNPSRKPVLQRDGVEVPDGDWREFVAQRDGVE